MILASDILVDALRLHPPALAWLRTAPRPLYISGVTAMEVLAGCSNKSEWRNTSIFLAPFTLLWLSEAGMRKALNTILPLRLANGIGVYDTLIVATALEHELPLTTFNTKHFSHVLDLRIVQPYTRRVAFLAFLYF